MLAISEWDNRGDAERIGRSGSTRLRVSERRVGGRGGVQQVGWDSYEQSDRTADSCNTALTPIDWHKAHCHVEGTDLRAEREAAVDGREGRKEGHRIVGDEEESSWREAWVLQTKQSHPHRHRHDEEGSQTSQNEEGIGLVEDRRRDRNTAVAD